eukprot:TRINITY_DN2868_c0_g1_i4.p4 TRINITY_DN2868_c0_g1~~TRINITY_DN2868_c0_g1_i4.p4  ORF type:complete len:133 (+),score=21.44 TRINITY_DN2868_c0_g1_i4:38-436(+)
MFFFFKQKTAYEISACLVGSEMCIRDRNQCALVFLLHNTFLQPSYTFSQNARNISGQCSLGVTWPTFNTSALADKSLANLNYLSAEMTLSSVLIWHKIGTPDYFKIYRLLFSNLCVAITGNYEERVQIFQLI